MHRPHAYVEVCVQGKAKEYAVEFQNPRCEIKQGRFCSCSPRPQAFGLDIK